MSRQIQIENSQALDFSQDGWYSMKVPLRLQGCSRLIDLKAKSVHLESVHFSKANLRENLVRRIIEAIMEVSDAPILQAYPTLIVATSTMLDPINFPQTLQPDPLIYSCPVHISANNNRRDSDAAPFSVNVHASVS